MEEKIEKNFKRRKNQLEKLLCNTMDFKTTFKSYSTQQPLSIYWNTTMHNRTLVRVLIMTSLREALNLFRTLSTAPKSRPAIITSSEISKNL